MNPTPEQSQAPAGAPGGAANPPAPAAPAFGPADIAKAVQEALRAAREEERQAAAKSAADPVAALKAEVEQTRAEAEARVAKAVQAAREEERTRAALIRELDRSGAHDPEAVLALHPDLLKAADRAAEIAAVQKARGYLFKAAEAASAPAPQRSLVPPSLGSVSPSGSAPNDAAVRARQLLGIPTPDAAAGKSRVVRNQN